MTNLTIITIVKDDYEGLLQTIKSVELFASSPNVMHLIWVCAASKNLDDYQLISETPQRQVIIGHDEGIWDAMNKASERADGALLLFLNARDAFLSPLDVPALSTGCLLPVEYVDWFGRLRRVNCQKNLRKGIPYCHQGIVFPNLGIKYDTRYKFGADYLYILASFETWPPPTISGALVRYDNSGVSSRRRLEADLWITKCVYSRFGLGPASYIFTRSIAKSIVRVALLPFRDLFRAALWDK